MLRVAPDLIDLRSDLKIIHLITTARIHHHFMIPLGYNLEMETIKSRAPLGKFMKFEVDGDHLITELPIPVSEIEIRELAEVNDERETFLSIYIPTRTDDHHVNNRSYISSRLRAIRKALPHELLEIFEATWEMVEGYVTAHSVNNEKGRIIFASSTLDFLHVYLLTIEPERKFILDASPFLLPLAEMIEEYQDYGIVLLDSHEAHLLLVKSDQCHELEHESFDLMNKHKKGGMSQMRFNRLRKGSIESFIGEVIEDIEKMREVHGLRGLVIAGPGEAKKHLISELPEDISRMVIGTIDSKVDMTCGELVEAGDEIADAREGEEERELVERLRSTILKGGPAVYGITEVHDALLQARVGDLIVLEGTSIPGWFCERCESLKEKVKPPKKCPNCGAPTTVVDVIETLCEMGIRTDAHIEFIKEDPFLDSLGGIGAILRY